MTTHCNYEIYENLKKRITRNTASTAQKFHIKEQQEQIYKHYDNTMKHVKPL